MKPTKSRRQPGVRLLNLWVSKEMVPVLDSGVRLLDLDRSKFVRQAIREKLVRHGIPVDPYLVS